MIIYQIYPRSFLDTNGDGIGDLAGVIARLDYVKALGVDAIWLSPFFTSPMKDFGYDISDHRAVDPSFGTLADFRRLVQRARELSLGVLIDLVGSHTSEAHPWFKDSVARTNDRDDWYLWADPKSDGSPPNNWVSVFGGSAWQWSAVRRQYFYHAFLPSQPDLNLHHPVVQEELIAIMRFWLEEGITGFRLDATNHYFQDVRLRDNPSKPDVSGALHPYAYQVHVHDQGQPEILPFLARIRKVLDAYGAFSVGEVGGTDPIALMGDYTGSSGLHSAYSFALMRGAQSAAYMRDTLQRIQSSVTSPARPCYAFSNHDMPRVVTRWGRGRDPRAVAKQYLALLVSLPGNLCLYQGEELGLPEADVPFERLRDPYGLTFWPVFKGRDGARTPMPWTPGENAGFSAGEPWLPIPAEHQALNVRDQEDDPTSVLHFARRALALRRERHELMEGDIVFLDRGDDVLAFARTSGGKTTQCVFNLGLAPCVLRLASELDSAALDEAAAWENGTVRLDVGGFVLSCSSGGKLNRLAIHRIQSEG